MQEGTHLGSQSDVSYNTIRFTELIKSDVKITPVYNTQGTAIKYSQYSFKFVAIVSTETLINGASTATTTDSRLEIIRQRLLVSGKEFTYNDKGLGSNLSISSSSPNYDVRYGPKPTLLAFEPIGNNKTVRIVFQIDMHLTDCAGVASQPIGVAEFWYTYKLSINKMGYRKMSREGYIEIIDRRSNNQRTGQHLTDFYTEYLRSLLAGDDLEQFHLEQSYDFSKDGLSCTFSHSFTEIESPNAYPAGVAEIDAKHKTASKLLGDDIFQKGFNTWTNTLDINVVLRPGVPKVFAWVIFTLLAQQRIGESISVVVENTAAGNEIEIVRVPIILSIEIEEDIFGHGASFSVTWVSHSSTIEDVLARAGMFKAIEGTDWRQWQTDIRDSVQNYSGKDNRIDFNASNRLIITPCISSGTDGENSPAQSPAEQAAALFNAECPPSNSNYLTLQNKFKVLPTAGIRIHRRYRGAEQIDRQPVETSNVSDQYSVSKAYNRNVVEKDYFLQDTGNDVMKVQMRGYALRLGEPARPPEIKEYGGRRVSIIPHKDDMIDSTVMSANNTCPVYLTRWVVTFEVLGSIVDANVETDRESNGEPGNYS